LSAQILYLPVVMPMKFVAFVSVPCWDFP
jgi:hypothetical protein